jgi:hypothetical protein
MASQGAPKALFMSSLGSPVFQGKSVHIDEAGGTTAATFTDATPVMACDQQPACPALQRDRAAYRALSTDIVPETVFIA